jgi:hypothetical protein
LARCGQANSGTSSKPTFNTASDLLLPVKLLKPQNGSLQRALANVLCYIVFQLGCENGSLKNSAQGASQLLYSKLAKTFQLSSWKEMDHLPNSNELRLPGERWVRGVNPALCHQVGPIQGLGLVNEGLVKFANGVHAEQVQVLRGAGLRSVDFRGLVDGGSLLPLQQLVCELLLPLGDSLSGTHFAEVDTSKRLKVEAPSAVAMVQKRKSHDKHATDSAARTERKKVKSTASTSGSDPAQTQVMRRVQSNVVCGGVWGKC